MNRTEMDKMRAGTFYNAFVPELIEARARAAQLCDQLNRHGKSTPEKRRLLLEKLLGHCGENVWVESPFLCDYGSEIFIGNNVFINFNCTILDGAAVRIGNDVLLGPSVQIYSATHPTNWRIRKEGLEYALPITIEDNVWIGGGVVICPGVTIGARSTIGAGSVITKNVPPDVVAAGNPCHVIRTVDA
ncbi:MAG: sugar O-acetyltransferase [Deltaproteobacteria bacterium]|nr:sugar O-acetyltransferase [Deltaproteobacteria bacterium]